MLHGQPLYDTRIGSGNSYFTYPPVSALIFTPLAVISFAVATVLMATISLAALLTSLLGALRLEPVASWVRARDRPTVALAAGAAAVWLEPVLTTLGYGQIDLVIAALVVCDLARPDRARTKGAMIGVAAGLKLTPAIFIVYLLLTRRLRAVGCALASFALTVAAGFALVPRDAGRYWSGLAFHSSRLGGAQNPADQSLRGAIARLLGSIHIQTPWVPLMVALTAVGLTLAVRASRRGDQATGFSLCALTGLLASPISWTHHWTIAVPALLLLGVVAYQRRSLAGLLATAAVAAVGYSHITWGIPRSEDLRLGAIGQIRADAYILIAVVAIAVAMRTKPRPGNLRPDAG
jgi:alpha-1,2-mannosyltransferase